jgi:hypothetical protein
MYQSNKREALGNIPAKTAMPVKGAAMKNAVYV